MKAANIICIFVHLILFGSCEWNVETDKCNDIALSQLLKFTDCKVSMDHENYLHAICDMFCFIRSGSLTPSEKLSALLVSWGLRSREPVTSFDDLICLWMTNVTIEKLVNPSRSITIGTQFYLEIGWELFLLQFDEGYMEVVFHPLGRMVATASLAKSCNSSEMIFPVSIKKINCKLSLFAVLPMILSGRWLVDINASKSNIYENIKRFDSIYLTKDATVSVFRLKLNNFLLDQKIFISILQRFNMSSIELCKTNFESITEEDFQGSYLKSLKLTEGVIQTITPNAFRHLRNLEILDLSYNRLRKIPDAIFVDSLKKLAYLSMEGNTPPTTTFTLNMNGTRRSPLLTLRLSRNSIQKLSDYAFHAFPQLKELYLDWCNLTFISNFTFDNLTFLVVLDLTGNNIDSLPESVFLPLRSLEYLSLSRNRLTRFSNSLSDSLLTLSTLNLENNRLEELFDIPPNLSDLNLKGNSIKSWSSSNLSHLHRLDLSSNAISVLSEGSISALEGIEKVDLSMNPYNCSPCSLYRLQQWLKRPNAENIESYTCNTPFDLAGEVALHRPPTSDDACLVKATNTVLIGIVSFVCILAFVGIVTGTGYYFRLYIQYFVFMLKSRRRSDDTPPDYDAFVSYANSEREWVANELIPNLENGEAGFRFCIHDRDFMAGDAITKNIIDCIDNSRKVLLILSRTYVESQWCTLEAHLAQHRLFEERKDSLVIVKIGHIPSKSLRRYFSYLVKTRTCLEWPSTEESKQLFWKKLQNYLSKEKE